MPRKSNAGVKPWLTLLCAASLIGCASSPPSAICPAPQPIPASLLTPPPPTDYSLNAQTDIRRWRTTLETARAALAASNPSSNPNR